MPLTDHERAALYGEIEDYANEQASDEQVSANETAGMPQSIELLTDKLNKSIESLKFPDASEQISDVGKRIDNLTNALVSAFGVFALAPDAVLKVAEQLVSLRKDVAASTAATNKMATAIGEVVKMQGNIRAALSAEKELVFDAKGDPIGIRPVANRFDA